MIKQVLHLFDLICGAITGFAFFDAIKVSLEIPIMNNIDNGIKLGSAFMAMVYLGLRTYFYYHKSQGERLILKEKIRSLEIENNTKDMQNHLFGKELLELKKLKELEEKNSLTN